MDRNLWKALNYQVLLKTRHPSSRVRSIRDVTLNQSYVLIVFKLKHVLSPLTFGSVQPMSGFKTPQHTVVCT